MHIVRHVELYEINPQPPLMVLLPYVFFLCFEMSAGYKIKEQTKTRAFVLTRALRYFTAFDVNIR